jgi:hypothetical protein
MKYLQGVKLFHAITPVNMKKKMSIPCEITLSCTIKENDGDEEILSYLISVDSYRQIRSDDENKYYKKIIGLEKTNSSIELTPIQFKDMFSSAKLEIKESKKEYEGKSLEIPKTNKIILPTIISQDKKFTAEDKRKMAIIREKIIKDEDLSLEEFEFLEIGD